MLKRVCNPFHLGIHLFRSKKVQTCRSTAMKIYLNTRTLNLLLNKIYTEDRGATRPKQNRERIRRHKHTYIHTDTHRDTYTNCEQGYDQCRGIHERSLREENSTNGICAIHQDGAGTILNAYLYANLARRSRYVSECISIRESRHSCGITCLLHFLKRHKNPRCLVKLKKG